MRRVPDVLPGQRSIARECAHLPNGSRVLSVGEGDGYYLIDLAQSFPHLRFFGFDIDLNKIRAAEQTRRDHGVANIWFFVADACEMAVKTKCFPFTHVRNVIHLVPDPDRCLRESARVTTEIVLFRDAPNWPFYRWLRFLQWATLKMRRRPNADIVLRGVRYATPLMTVKRNALEWARWMRGTDLFRDVRIVGHDLLWWDVDRPLGVLGLIGARVGFRCVVA